ncbi:MAG TPA: pitrilysin family protein [Clostridia bacterium]|nr:pitrilysin family protein [Clostridia bacterium]
MYKRKRLCNEIQVVTERIPHFRSVSIGLWFRAGSVYESEDQNGLSHFIEHMLFKGTKRRTAKDIAQTLDAVGGQLNAFTAKECTCFYSKVLDEHLELSLELLADMVFNSTFCETEMEKEKGVILEEISMYEDSPNDVVHELLSANFFKSHPLGSPILGTRENVGGFTRQKLQDYFNRFYVPQNLVISIAGNYDETSLYQVLDKYFGNWTEPEHEFGKPSLFTPGGGVFYRYKDIEQTHLCIGCPGIVLGDEDIYPLMVFNNIFGGGMSSRLFQRIREEHGLAYSVFSFPSSYTHGGLFTIYGGLRPSQVDQTMDLVVQEIRAIKKGNITREELSMAREQLKGNYILGLESTNSRMTAIGRNQLLLGRTMTPDEVLTKIDNVTMDNIYKVLDGMFLRESTAIAAVSKEDPTERLSDLF